MLTKRNYDAIAKIIHETSGVEVVGDRDISEGELVRRLSEYFGTDNPYFSPGKFWEAARGRHV